MAGNTMKNAWRSPELGAAPIVLLTLAAYVATMRGRSVWDGDVPTVESQMAKADDGLCRLWLTAGIVSA